MGNNTSIKTNLSRATISLKDFVLDFHSIFKNKIKKLDWKMIDGLNWLTILTLETILSFYKFGPLNDQILTNSNKNGAYINIYTFQKEIYSPCWSLIDERWYEVKRQNGRVNKWGRVDILISTRQLNLIYRIKSNLNSKPFDLKSTVVIYYIKKFFLEDRWLPIWPYFVLNFSSYHFQLYIFVEWISTNIIFNYLCWTSCKIINILILKIFNFCHLKKRVLWQFQADSLEYILEHFSY